MRAIVALALVLTACGGTAATPEPTEAGQDITGTFALHAQSGQFSGACEGTGGYSDIAAGMNITLEDGEGNVLGTSRFSNGQASEDRQLCEFTFGFEDVPNADFYVLNAGDRGEQTYSRADMEAMDWDVALEIGN